ncbi:nucleotidyltransferase domain-containing protein (plasmid) [Rhizobium leguminosarum]|nr:nucleotidyltransferase domain-containing protein [Rhizobium leguminosarum]
MDASGVASFILSSCPSLSEFEPYMFGSSLHGVGEDIDILVVGPSGEPLARLKKEMMKAAEELPLHVLYMLPSEAVETGFVAEEGCAALSKLALEG